MTPANNDKHVGQQIENVLDSLEALAICSGGAAFTGLAIGGLFGNAQTAGAVIGAIAGFAFWGFHPHAPKG